MKSKDFFNKHLIDSLSIIKNFVDSNSINYIKIPNIEISKFTIPTFNFSGKFELGSTAYRDEYVQYVQCSLKGITNPCLYMFELLSPNLEEVFKTYKAFSDEQDKIVGIGKRSCSSLKNSFLKKEKMSQILYVGKSENPIDGRIVVHFGYYEKGVSGLQLVYWGKEINLKVNLHVFELVNKEIQNYIDPLEKLFFIQLNPLIGKK